jgi:hypothetical protein
MFLLLDNNSVFVLAYSEELNCAVPSSLPLSSVDLGGTDPTQKEGPAISFPLYRCCPETVSTPL